MSIKRVAPTDLNQDNWEDEDPSENMGNFKTAPKEMLEKRVMRTAKRRSQASSDESKKSVFSGFGGFHKAQPQSFDFLANLTNISKTNGAGTKSDTAVTSSLFSSRPTTAPSGGLFGIPQPSSNPAFSTTQTSPFASTAIKTETPSMLFSSSKADSTVGDSPFKMQSVSSSADSSAKSSTATHVSSTIFGVSSTSPNQNKPSTNTMLKQPVSSTSTAVQNSAAVATQSNSIKDEAAFEKEAEIEKARNKYYSKLKGLNESVSSWIVKHVEKTPLCFLSPIFKDYENYLKEIQEEYEAAKVDIEAKSKKQTEVKSVFGSKDGASSFSNTSAGINQDSKHNQPFCINSASDGNTNAASTGLFGQSSTASYSKSPSKTTTPTKGLPFGVTSTPAQNTNSSPFPTKAENTTSPTQGFSFGITSTSPANTNSAFAANPGNVASPPSKGFSFGMSTTGATSPNNTSPFSTGANISPPVKGFSFGMTQPAATSPTNSVTNAATAAAPFSFGIGSGSPFSFNSQTQHQTTDTQQDDEEDQPPKVEYTPVVEENSVFDKKCKIFVKKDGNFVDKGVGTLYVKKIQDSGKYQLLVRANTNLGTVLLNLILVSAVPTQRMGKNNVMLVCIPTPDAEPPPTPVLIRVKTEEEAEELLGILNKYKS